MCTGRCCCLTAGVLYPLSLTSIICNFILFFPDWKVTYILEKKITHEVICMGGLVGGLTVLAPALFVHVISKRLPCVKCCGLFVSVLFAAIGLCGAIYSFVLALTGLLNGPYCEYSSTWVVPFKDSNGEYLRDRSLWTWCTEPKDVVEFNVILFSILITCNILQIIVCASQIINSLLGCICGVCGACGACLVSMSVRFAQRAANQVV